MSEKSTGLNSISEVHVKLRKLNERLTNAQFHDVCVVRPCDHQTYEEEWHQVAACDAVAKTTFTHLKVSSVLALQYQSKLTDSATYSKRAF